MTCWFNENDPFPAAWLRNLWPEATVDERSIEQLEPGDIPGGRCHFFAGIGGWEYALELAGWPRDREVWTGSCPCQPFSAAGKRKGVEDERHLWPAWLRLIAERRPATIFGEQVASRLGREWLAGVRLDLDSLGYAVGAADLCAASVGAPHIRQRLWWAAYAQCGGLYREADDSRSGGPDLAGRGRGVQPKGSRTGGVALPESDGRGEGRAESVGRIAAERRGESGVEYPGRRRRGTAKASVRSRRGGAELDGRMGHSEHDGREGEREPEPRGVEGARGNVVNGSNHWAGAAWISCADGKARRVEPGIRLLAHGVSARVGRLRAYGNAIVPQVAATFIRAVMETL